MGVGVEEFGFGYPPRLFGIKIGETLYSVNLLPFGGFVKLYGEEEAAFEKEKKDLEVKKDITVEETSVAGYSEVHSAAGDSVEFYSQEKIIVDKEEEPRLKKAFFAQSKKVRMAVILAGVVGNFLLGVLCFSYVYSRIGIPEKKDTVRIIEIKKDSPADKAGFLTDDEIIKIKDKKMGSIEEFVNSLKEVKEQEVDFTVRRGEETLILRATPRENPPEGEGALGVLISPIEMVFYPSWQMPFRGAWVGLKEAISWGLMIVGGIFLVIKQLFMGITPDVTGPVGIFQITSQVAKQGFLNTVQFVGILSVNLAVLNIFPFPALDGGRLAFILLEKVIGKKLKPKIEQTINLIGIAILISLMLLVTLNDLVRLFRSSQVLSRILSFFQLAIK